MSGQVLSSSTAQGCNPTRAAPSQPAKSANLLIGPTLSDSILFTWSPVVNTVIQDTLLVYHNDPSVSRPAKIPMMGNSNPVALLAVNTTAYNFGSVDINTVRRDTNVYRPQHRDRT